MTVTDKPVQCLPVILFVSLALKPTCHCFHQCVYASCLSSPTWPQGHHAMPDPLSLKQLDDLQLPGRMYDQTCVLNLSEHNNSVQIFTSWTWMNEGTYFTSLASLMVSDPFVFLWVLYLDAFKSDVKYCIQLSNSPLVFWLIKAILLIALSKLCLPLSVSFLPFLSPRHTYTNSSLTPPLPVSRWQPLVLDSLLYQVGYQGKGPRSGSGRAAHPHQSNKQKHADRHKRAKNTEYPSCEIYLWSSGESIFNFCKTDDLLEVLLYSMLF